MGTTGQRTSLLLVLAASFLLNLWGISYGLPAGGRGWDHDEIVPRYVLGTMAKGPLSGAWPVKYPQFHYYVLAPLYRVGFFFGDLGWLDREPGLEYTRLFYLTRAVSLLMGTATVLLLYLASRQALTHTASLFAAVTYALVAPAVFYAKLGNLDTPYVFWFALSWWLYLRALRRNQVLDYVGFGLAAAMAVGTKDQAYGLYALAPLPLLIALYRHRRATGASVSPLRVLFDPRLVLGGLASGLLFVFGHQILLRPAIFARHVDKITGPYSADYRFFENDWHGQLANLRLSIVNTHFSLGTPLAVAALVGMGLVCFRYRRSPGAAAATGGPIGPRFLLGSTLLLAVGYQLTFLSVILYNYERYFMPHCLVLAPFAGVALAWAWAARWPAARLGGLAVAALLGVSAARVIEMDLAMVFDSRYAAEDWVSARLADGEYALALGDPQRNPRLPYRGWNGLTRNRGAVIRDANPRFLVLNQSDLGPSLPGAAKGSELALSGALGYDVRWRYRYPLPLGLFDPSGTTGSLFFINPEMVVLERRESLWWDRLTRVVGESPGPLLRAAARQRDNGRFTEALALDMHAIGRHPSSLLARTAVALDLQGLGRFDEAIEGLRLAPQRSSEPVLAAASAHALTAAGRVEAMSAAVEAARLAPTSALVAVVEAKAATAAGLTAAAIRALQRAVTLGTGQREGEIVASAAWALVEAGAVEQAATAMVRASTLPRSVGIEAARREAARLLGEVGRAADAESFLAAARDPSAPAPGLVNPGEFRPHVYGTSAEENSAQFGSYRWTGGCALAFIEDLGSDVEIEIRYRCGGEAERDAWLSAPGGAPLRLPCGADAPQTMRMPLRHSQVGSWPMLPVGIEVSAPFVPAELWRTEDHRELGLQLISFIVRAVPAGDFAPPEIDRPSPRSP